MSNITYRQLDISRGSSDLLKQQVLLEATNLPGTVDDLATMRDALNGVDEDGEPTDILYAPFGAFDGDELVSDYLAGVLKLENGGSHIAITYNSTKQGYGSDVDLENFTNAFNWAVGAANNIGSPARLLLQEGGDAEVCKVLGLKRIFRKDGDVLREIEYEQGALKHDEATGKPMTPNVKLRLWAMSLDGNFTADLLKEANEASQRWSSEWAEGDFENLGAVVVHEGYIDSLFGKFNAQLVGNPELVLLSDDEIVERRLAGETIVEYAESDMAEAA